MEGWEPSAERVHIDELDNDKARVRIDRGETIILDPIVWRTLWVLLLDWGHHEGRYVDWKTLHQIRHELEKKLEHDEKPLPRDGITEHSVRQNIYRLRKALVEAGYAKSLVPWKRFHGYRFALLREAALGYGT